MSNYFYIDSDGKQHGPFSPEKLKIEGITPETMVWTSGMPDWIQAQNAIELKFLFQEEVSSVSTIADEDSHQNNKPYNQLPYNENRYYNRRPYNQDRQNNYNNPLNRYLPMPKTWLVESILITIFCCLPFGIAGLIYASKVESLYNAGDYDGSLEASRKAGFWIKLSAFLSLAAIVLYMLGKMFESDSYSY